MPSTAGVTPGATTSTSAPAASSPLTRRCATVPPPTTTTRRPARSSPTRYGSVISLPRHGVAVPVSVRRVVRVVVRGLRGAHLVLEAGQQHPVRAGVAVHPDVAVQRLPVALDDQPGQLVGVAQVGRDPHLDVGVRPAE